MADPNPFPPRPPAASIQRVDQLRRMAEMTHRPSTRIAGEYGRLAAGQGRLTFDDYVELRLFDDSFLEGADKSLFAGRQANSELIDDINYDHEAYILATNKLAGSSFLAAHGFKTPTLRALYRRGLSSRGDHVTSSPQELCRFLRTSEHYPLFGKPLDGEQSLGALLLTERPDADGLLDLGHMSLTPEALAGHIDRNYPRGYLFQSALKAPQELSPVTGGALGTVRVVTLRDGDEVQAVRACLKLPTLGNIADNYWRPGNLLARVAPESGSILAATSGSGLELRTVDLAHEFAGVLDGLKLRGWSSYLETARQAHSVVQGLSMIGWDVGYTADGPVIVELNASPNNLLIQLADRRGLLDGQFARLAERGRRARKALRKETKRGRLDFILRRQG